MTVCIDSQIIIWGIKKQSSAGQENLIIQAEYFFKWIDEQKHDVIIPSIVLAEIFAPEPAESRAKYLEYFNKNFIIVNFDTRTALKYAQILHGRKEEIKQLMTQNDIPRQKMKADHLIVACAIVNNAKCIYSYDPGLKAFAQSFIEVRDMPALPPQQTQLF